MSEAAQLSRDQVKDFLKNLSLLDAAALVKELEAELGVSAAAIAILTDSDNTNSRAVGDYADIAILSGGGKPR